MQHGVLWSDGCVIQSCGNRMRQRDLPGVVLQHVGKRPLQYAWRSALKTCRVFSKYRAAATRFHADQADFLVWNELIECANGIRSAAHASDHGVGQAIFFFENLLARFFADDAMEIAHHDRIWMGAEHAT